MKHSFSLFLLLCLLLKTAVYAQPVLLPSIGLAALPDDTASLCDAPWYLGNYNQSGLVPGDTASDFTLYDLNNNPHNLLAALQTGKPALIIAGSFTCPVFRGKISTINALASQYVNDLNIFVIYELEAHPDIDTSAYFGYPNPGNANIQAGILYRQPSTYGGRKAIAQDCIDSLPINATVLIDGPCNEFWSHYGPAPNNAYLIDTNGIVFAKHGWFDKYPQDIFCDIDSLLGNPSSCNSTLGGAFQWQLIGSNIVYGSPGQTLYSYGRFINPSSADVLISMVKDPELVPSAWATSICTDVCYPTTTDSATLLLAAGDTLLYTMYFYTDAIPDSGRVRMKFRNLNNPQNGFNQGFKGFTELGTAIGNDLEQTAFRAYPNPFRENLRIQLEQGITGSEVQLYDLHGRLLLEQKVDETGLLILDTSNLPAGVYICVSRQKDVWQNARKVVRID